MKTYEMAQGSRIVVINEDREHALPFSARLYLNNGETASTQVWKGKTKAGAEKWARRVLTH